MGPTEDQNGADVTVSSGSPADGRDQAAAAAAGGVARAEGAQVARERAIQEQGEAQRAALLEQAEEAAAKLKELMPSYTWRRRKDSKRLRKRGGRPQKHP
jgi:hypothetical protein